MDKLSPEQLDAYLKLMERYGLAPLIVMVCGIVFLLGVWSIVRTIKPLMVQLIQSLISNVQTQEKTLPELKTELASFRGDIKTFHETNRGDREILERIDTNTVNAPDTLDRIERTVLEIHGRTAACEDRHPDETA